MKRACCRFGNQVSMFLLLTLIAGICPIAFADETKQSAILLHAARVFDGHDMRADLSMLIRDGRVAQVGPRGSFASENAKVIDLGDATILPGFIELHAHLTYQQVPADTVLKHGITTIRDVGGPIHQPYGGNGTLRVLTSGPIITAPGGYPIPLIGEKNIAVPVSTEKEARKTVQNLIKGGVVVIKIALEPGGEPGAPWSSNHGHGHHHSGGHGHPQEEAHQGHATVSHPPAHHTHATHGHSVVNADAKQAWPLLSEKIVKAIVDEAHINQRRVTAHIAEARGAQVAINAGVDEWAHVPCDVIPESLLKRAVAQKVKIVTTLDTLSKCPGVAQNARVWAELGGELLYGAEIAHPDVPRGINAQELIYMMQLGKMGMMDVLQAATSKAGEYLGFPLLGTLQSGAPADIIAVKGNPTHNLKNLEYPDLVISGGKIVINNF
ncbi:Imidazolonepropionase [Nitrosospira multiformis]|uniref:Imidazolonepropionase n=1 Tax=Nitrosospira multiformis TaxID=1231 RepID=A0A1H8MZ08_9PROT|nr:amidohydrolase family protein [Nitrosospira multiformis]SEO22625.1 Imidazolonepropionase [Nitrosospira multiformis]